MFRSVESFGNHGENPFSYMESPKFKEAVHKLESLTGLLPRSKALILVTALDLKPATEFEFSGSPQEKAELIDTLSNLGLYFFENEEKTKFCESIGKHGVQTFTIGNTPEHIGAGMAATVDDNEHFGLAMGFPETAVDAYSSGNGGYNNDLLLRREELKNILTDEERKFLFFRLSKESYEKEVEWIEQIIAAVKQHSPEIYNQVMKENIV